MQRSQLKSIAPSATSGSTVQMKNTYDNDGHHPPTQSLLAHQAPNKPIVGSDEQVPGGSGLDVDLDDLFAETRGAMDQTTLERDILKQQEILRRRRQAADSNLKESSSQTQHNLQIENGDVSCSSSEEEGEICGDSTQPTSVDRADEPIKSIENSKDTTTDSLEKQVRQSETKMVYQTLKKGDKNKRREKAHPNAIHAKSGKGAISQSKKSKQSRPAQQLLSNSRLRTMTGQDGHFHQQQIGYDRYIPSQDHEEQRKNAFDKRASRGGDTSFKPPGMFLNYVELIRSHVVG